MILTKETYIIHVGCALIAGGMTWGLHLFRPTKDARPARQTWGYQDLAVVCGAAIALIVFFYSGTFFNWSGVKGLYQTFHTWFQTGHNGNGHEKPFYYWLMLIGRYEWPVALGSLRLRARALLQEPERPFYRYLCGGNAACLQHCSL